MMGPTGQGKGLREEGVQKVLETGRPSCSWCGWRRAWDGGRGFWAQSDHREGAAPCWRQPPQQVGGGAAFHLCGGEGRDRQEEEAHLGVGVSQNQTPGGPGQVPHLLTLACAQDSRGFSGDAPQNRNHWCFNQGG